MSARGAIVVVEVDVQGPRRAAALNMALLEVVGLRTQFATDEGEFAAVDGINFAVDGGQTVDQITGRIVMLNLLLVVLMLAVLLYPSALTEGIAAAVGLMACGLVIRRFRTAVQ